jgi:hypothetical protein
MAVFEKTPFNGAREAAARLFCGGSSGNEVLEGDGFYLSYNPATDVGPETALVCWEKSAFFLLLGDYRQAYAELAPQGWEACLAFFRAQPEGQRSPWSDEP